MLSPNFVARSVVMDPGEVGKVVEGVGMGDAEFVGEFPGGRTTGTYSFPDSSVLPSRKQKRLRKGRTNLTLLVLLAKARQGVRTARVRPHLGERDFLVGSSLEEELARFRVEEED